MPHPRKGEEEGGHARFAGVPREHFRVARRRLVFPDHEEHRGQPAQVGVGGGEVGRARVGRPAVGRAAADILLIFGKRLIFGEGVQRVAVAVAPIGVAGGGEVGKRRDADDRVGQAQPLVPRAQAAGEEQVCAEAVPDGGERPLGRRCVQESAAGAETFVVHGGIQPLGSRPVIDGADAEPRRGIPLRGAAVEVVHADRVPAAVEVEEVRRVLRRLQDFRPHAVRFSDGEGKAARRAIFFAAETDGAGEGSVLPARRVGVQPQQRPHQPRPQGDHSSSSRARIFWTSGFKIRLTSTPERM